MTDAQGNIRSNITLKMSITGAVQTSDGDYIFAGTNGNIFDAEYGNLALMIKTDQNGELLWNKTVYTFPSGSRPVMSNIAKANDGGYFVAAWDSTYSNAIGNSFTNLWLLKTDSNGNLLFSKRFSYNANAGINQNPAVIDSVYVTPTKDDGCLLTGGSTPFFVKLTENGDWQWSRSYPNGVTTRAALTSAVQTPAGEYIAYGAYPNSGNNNVLIIKTDANGNLTWNQTFTSSANFADASSSILTNDGGFAVLGSLNGNVWLAKFAAESNIATIFPSSSIVAVSVASVFLVVIGYRSFSF